MKTLSLIATFIFCVAFSNPVFATAQTPEVLLLDGKKEDMFCEPLEAYFEKGHPRPKIFEEPTSTALWRGYIGTWEIKNNELFLISLGRENYRTENGETKFSIDTIPLTSVFPQEKPPIKATWFSGVISVPSGEMLRYVHMGFGSVFSKVLYLTVKEGRVVAKREIDNREFGATRSDADMQWVAMAETPLTEDWTWIDARSIETSPPSGAFKTRGIYFPATNGEPAQLWIPDTPATEALNLRLSSVPTSASVAAGSHVEVTGSLEDKSAGAIKVESIRELKGGETMHHQTFKKSESVLSPEQK